MVLLLFSTENMFAQKADAIVGTWLIQDNDGHVEIFEKDGKYYGKIAWMKFPKDEDGNDKVDDLNPDPKLRSRKKLGLVIMQGFIFIQNQGEGPFEGRIEIDIILQIIRPEALHQFE